MIDAIDATTETTLEGALDFLTAEVDGSTTNEINTLTLPDANVTAGLGITFAQAGSLAITESAADTVLFTVTETDPIAATFDTLYVPYTGARNNINLNSKNLTTSGTIFANVTGALTGNADTVTTNANLTGEVTSVGNATTIADSVAVTSWNLTTPTITTSLTTSTPTTLSAAELDRLDGLSSAIIDDDKIDTFSELDSIVVDKDLVNKADGAVWLGVHDFGGATSLEIPNSNASPSVAGQLRLDTTVTGLINGCLEYFSGDVRYVVDLDTIPVDGDDDKVIAYDKDADKFYMKTDATTAGGNSKSFVITNPTSSSDKPVWKTPSAITITAVHLLCIDTTAIGHLDKCDANGNNCAGVDGVTDITGISRNNVNDDGSLSNASIDAGDYVGWHTTSETGAATGETLIVTFDYN